MSRFTGGLRELAWRKASSSVGDGACVEVAFMNRTILVRDSKNPHGSTLAYTAREWKAFIDGVKNGNFDCIWG